jgi:hypothetical protein
MLHKPCKSGMAHYTALPDGALGAATRPIRISRNNCLLSLLI